MVRRPPPSGGGGGISPEAATGIAVGAAVVGGIIGSAINSMTQQNQPPPPGIEPAGSAPQPSYTGPEEVGSDADPSVMALPPGTQLAQAAGAAAGTADFQKNINVAAGVPPEVERVKNRLGPGDHCWSLPAAYLGLKTPPANGVSYGSAQELINAAAIDGHKVTELPPGAAPPPVLAPNQAIVVADWDPKTKTYTTGHCGVGDAAGGVNDFTKPAPNAPVPIPAKINHSTSPDAFVNQSVTRPQPGSGGTFTVQPFAGKRIIIITR